MLRAVTALSLVCIAPVAAIGQAPNLQYMDLVLKAVPDGPVARVNGQMIPAADFRDLYVSELTGFARANPGTPISDEIRVAVRFPHDADAYPADRSAPDRLVTRTHGVRGRRRRGMGP